MNSPYASSSIPRRYSQSDITNANLNEGYTNTLYKEPLTYNIQSESISSSSHVSSSNQAAHTGHLPTQQEFGQKSKKILELLSGTQSILENLRETNKNQFTIQYPFININDCRKPQRTQSLSQIKPYKTLKRTNSLSDTINEESMSNFQQEVKYRLLTPEDSHEIYNSRVNVLKLDIKMQDSSFADMAYLEKNSIAQLLNSRIDKILNHLQSLVARVSDKSSKVLVAGDLNAGKSTFINALLRRSILPVDQQPCTALFCEVLDPRENGGIEAVHGIKDIKTYNLNDPSTYVEIGFENLERVAAENLDHYTFLKIYCQDRRLSHESLLHNGLVDISLIDCPGLNSDSLKTMAVFARQEEIDVIVFVVSAENHFTQSANDFLFNASNEKAYLFIVVNKFEQIKDKDKCKRAILDQIKKLSPRTHQYHHDLVHFVSANAISVDENPPRQQKIPEVDKLEDSLRTFVLKKRSWSKLAPASHYLSNLLYDLGVLSEYNRDVAQKEYELVTREIEEGEAGFNKLQRAANQVVKNAEQAAEKTCMSIHNNTKTRIEEAILNIHNAANVCEYSGLLYVWKYAIELRNIMLQKVHDELTASEKEAKEQTLTCVNDIQSMASQSLPSEPKIVNIEKIFSNRRVPVQIHIDASDFFDFNHNLDFGGRINDSFGGIVGISCTSLVMLGGPLMGANYLSTLLKVTNVVGLNNMRRLAIPILGLVGIGLAAYVLCDVRNAVSRNVARKIQSQLKQSNYADEEAIRLANLGRKATRRSINHLRDCFRRAIEAEEQKREEQRAKAKLSGEAKFYFTGLSSKAEEMSKILEHLGIEVGDYDDMAPR